VEYLFDVRALADLFACKTTLVVTEHLADLLACLPLHVGVAAHEKQELEEGHRYGVEGGDERADDIFLQ